MIRKKHTHTLNSNDGSLQQVAYPQVFFRKPHSVYEWFLFIPTQLEFES